MKLDPDALNDFERAIDAKVSKASRAKSSQVLAEVTRIDPDGTTWVHVFGGSDETPVRLMSSEAKPGDVITITLTGLSALGIGNMSSPAATASMLNSRAASIEQVIEALRGQQVEFESVTTEELSAQHAYIRDLEADTAKIHELTADELSASVAYIGDLAADNVTASDLVAAHGYIADLEADNVTAQNLVADHATVGDLNANYAQINLANVDTAYIDHGVIKVAAIVDEQVFAISGNKATIAKLDASRINVYNLRADNLIVSKINGQPVLGNYEAVNENQSGYSSKNPSQEGWYEFSNGGFVLSSDTTVDTAKAYFTKGTGTKLYDQDYIDDLADGLNQRIDGAIETWTGTAVPTMVTYPVSDWSQAEYANHVGDIYYVVNAASDEDGFCYRFAYDNATQQYMWVLIKDSDVTKALQDITDLQDFESETTSWIEETDQGLTTIRQNHTALSGTVAATARNMLANAITPTVLNQKFTHNLWESNKDKWILWNETTYGSLSKVSGAVRLDYLNESGNSGITIPLIAPNCVTNGETVNLTFRYRTNLTALGPVYLIYSNSNNVIQFSSAILEGDGEWHDFSKTFAVSWSANDCVAMLVGYVKAASGKYLEIKDGSAMLERGKSFMEFEQNTFKELVDEVDEQSSTITQMTETMQYGGANLILASDTMTDVDDVCNWNINSTASSIEGGVCTLVGDGAWREVAVACGLRLADYKDKYLTISFDMRAVSTGATFPPAVEVRPTSSALSVSRSGAYRTQSISPAPTTAWMRYSQTVHMVEGMFTSESANQPDWATSFFAVAVFNHSSIDYQIRHIKVEVGEIATSWGCAPQDVTTVSNTVNFVKQTADANTASISGLSTVVSNNGLTSTTNITSRASKIEQTLDGFSSTVGAIVDETVVGTNILTGNALNPYNWTISAPTGANYTKTAYGTAGVKATFNTVSGYELLYSPAITVTSGKKYTLSVEYTVGKDYTIVSGKGGFGLSVYKAVPTAAFDSSNANFIARAQFFETATRVAMKATVTFTASSNTVYLGLNGGQINDSQTGLSFTLDKLMLVENISSRVSTAETSISQTANAIGLTATGTATIANPNLTPFYSMPLDDVRNATTNPNGYWRSITASKTTKLTDGWAHVAMDNTSGTATMYVHIHPAIDTAPVVYGTLLIEIRNFTGTTTAASNLWYNAAATGGTEIPQMVNNSGTMGLGLGNGSYYHKMKPSGNTSPDRWARAWFGLSAGFSAEFDARLSFYEGDYTGPYKPYSGSQLYATQAEFKVTTDGISSVVSKIPGAKYLTSNVAGWALSSIKGYAVEGTETTFNVTSSQDVRVGDTVYIKGTDNTRNCPVYIKGTVVSIPASTQVRIAAHGYEDALPINTAISSINQSAETIKIQASKIEIDGTTTFTSGGTLSSYVQGKVDEVEVGGRNLLKKSADLSHWVISSCTVAAGKADPDGGTGAFLITPSSTGWYASAPITDIALKNVGEQYTFSIWLRADTATRCGLRGRYISGNYSSTAHRETFDISTEWKRYQITGELLQAQTSDAFWIGQITSDPIYAYHPKVEMGNKATDWSPAPEDQTAYADGLVDGLVIGGRNLATGTGTNLTFTQTSTPTYFSPAGFYSTSDTGLALLANTSNKSFIVSFDWTATGVTTAYQMFLSLQNSSTTYTAGNITARASVPTGNSSGHYSAVFEPNSNQRQYGGKWLLSRTTNTANTSGTVVLSNFMFEVATKESAWSLAPEDVMTKMQRIYQRKTASGAPTAPTTWLETSGTGYANWATRIPQLTSGSTKYPYLYTCVQTKKGNDAVENSPVLLDDSTTVIDGGNIITGSVTANRLDVNDINSKGLFTAGSLAQAVQTNISNGAAAYSRKTIYRGYCATPTGTAAKEVTCNGFVLEAGAVIEVYMNNSNSSIVTTLNVNSTGAKAVYIGDAPVSDTNRLLWHMKSTVTFLYDGEKYRVTNPPGSYYGTACTAGAGTATKESRVLGLVLFKGCVVEVPMTYANTSTSAVLRLNNTNGDASSLDGNIYYGPSKTTEIVPTTANGYGWLAGMSVIFKYDGKFWRTGNQTVIDGSHVTTGKVSADHIDVASINIGDLNGSLGGRNLVTGTSNTWKELTTTNTTNQTIALFSNFDVTAIPGIAVGDAISVSFDIAIPTATTRGSNATQNIQGNVNRGGSTWTGANFSSTGGSLSAEILDVFTNKKGKHVRLHTYFTVTAAMLNGTVTGNMDCNLRFDYWTGKVMVRRVMVERGKMASEWMPAPEEMAATATNYITADSTGIKIAKASDTSNYQYQTSSGTDIYVSGKKRTSTNANGLEVFDSDGTTSLAKFSTSARIGKASKWRAEVSSNGLDLYGDDNKKSIALMHYRDSGAGSRGGAFYFAPDLYSDSFGIYGGVVSSGASVLNVGYNSNSLPSILMQRYVGSDADNTYISLNVGSKYLKVTKSGISGLAASDIPTLTAAHIPSLAASKIGSGTFDAARIPGLAASKITSGTLDADRIPSLAASKIGSGTLPVARGGTGKSAGTCYMATAIYAFNTTGTDGTVTLTETAANFTFIDIFFKGNDGYYDFTRVYSPNGKVANLSTMESTASGNVNCKWKAVTISTTSITNKYYGEMDNGGTPASVNHIKICGVIGYK